MKYFLALALCATACYRLSAGQDEYSGIIKTAVPFLTLTPDARSSGMADIGTASAPDAYSLFHNASKYAFAESQSGVSASYTPWLSNLTGDMFIGYATYYHKVTKTSALAASFRCFSLGEVEMNDYQGGQVIPLGSYSPLELALDAAYAMQLSPRVALGVALRYVRSDISDRSDPSAADFHAANAFSADISAFYNSKKYELEQLDLTYTLGINIRDMGTKVSYGSSDIASGYDRLPTTMSLGAGVHMEFRGRHKLSILLQTDKLLVPSPVYDQAAGQYVTPDDGLLGGMWNSLWKCEGGISEKISEYSFQMGAQWGFADRFAVRTGWYYADQSKGGSQFLSLGASLKYKIAEIDLSYAIPTASSWDDSPISGTMRISVSFAFPGKRK